MSVVLGDPDGLDGSVVHLANHDVSLFVVSQSPLEKLQVYRRRMGWSFPWASSFDSDFNYDVRVTHTKEEWQSGAVEYNYGSMDVRPSESGVEIPLLTEWASNIGTDWPTYRQQEPGLSAFVLEDGVVYHTYSAYGRGRWHLGRVLVA